MTSDATCGSLYHALVTQLFPDHPLLDKAPAEQLPFACFALGTMQGQAEKVALGACRMFLIRPAPEWYAWALEAMHYICTHYGLLVIENATPREIWGVHPAWRWVANRAQATLYPSADAHYLRAQLCGIPPSQIDLHYHERESHGQRCEPGEAP